MLSKGGVIEGWKVTAITDNSVELVANGMHKTLKISSD
jgi:hypothetical protein